MKKIFTLFWLFCTYYSIAQVELVKITGSMGTPIYSVNGKLMFAAWDTHNYFQLYVSDGTTAGTTLLKSFYGTGPDHGQVMQADNVGWQHYEPIVFNNELYFFAFVVSSTYSGYSLWKTDGTSAGTVSVRNLGTEWGGYSFGSGFPSFCVLNNALYFSCGNNSYGVNLWKVDGGSAIKIINLSSTNFAGEGPSHLTVFNNAIYFVANDNVSGAEIWKSDGTAAGTHLLKDIFPGLDGVEGPYSAINPQFCASGNYLYFIGYRNTDYGYLNLYRTDGTEAGTERLDSTIYMADVATYLFPFHADVNGTAYYTGYPNASTLNTSAIFKSPPSPAGIVNVATNNNIKAEGIFTSFNNRLFFLGSQGSGNVLDYGLFSSDGTTAGTSMVYNLPYNSSYPILQDFVTTPNSLFFRTTMKVSNTASGSRIIQSDGTAAGTKMYWGADALGRPVVYNGYVYFLGNDTASSTNTTFGLYKLLPVPGSATLPVNLTGFTASLTSREQVLLNWQTATETNNKGFYIERSTNGKEFTELQFVPGAGTSTQLRPYSWTDEHPVSGKSYYRLRQEDNDSRKSYSAVRQMTLNTTNQLMIMPNPVRNSRLTIQHGITGPVQLQVLDMGGHVLLTNTYAGGNAIQCDVQSLKAGIYLLKLSSSNKTVVTRRFVKK